MIKAFIFDMDGTLADTEPQHYRAWRATLLNNGAEEFSFEKFLTYVGTSNETVATDHIRKTGILKSVQELVREKQVHYLEMIPEIQLFAGARQVLETYTGRVTFAVASSSHHRELTEILRSNKILDYFSSVIGGDMVTHRKPDPEIYLKTLQAIGVPAGSCLAFEDSTHGVNAAKNAKIYGIAIPNEFTRNHDFSRADRVITSFHDVNDELLKSVVEGGS